MTTEQQVVVLLSKIEFSQNDLSYFNSIKNSLDWNFIFTQLFSHKLMQIAYHNLTVNNLFDAVPVKICGYLENQFEQTLTLQRLLLEETKIITNKLKTNNIDFLFLKGTFLANAVYPFGTRKSNDIDIFINKESYSVVRECLLELGFLDSLNDEHISLNDKYLILLTYEYPEFTRQVNSHKLVVDVQHTYQFARQFNYIIDFNSEFKRSTNICIDNNKIPVQSIYDLILHLCSHTFGNCTVVSEVCLGEAMSIRQFADIYNCIYKFIDKFDVDKFIALVYNKNMQLQIAYCFFYILKLYQFDYKTPTFNKAKDIYSKVFNNQIEHFENICGLENGIENIFFWEDTFENKFFEFDSYATVCNHFKNTIKEYSIYDSRFK